MAPRPQNQKRRPESARRANRIIQTRTLLLLGVFGVLTFVLLFTQLYRWQITEHDELQSVAVRQQTLRTTVEASRGTIYDRNGTILAMSASAEDIFISPKEIIENDQDQNLIAGGLAEILDLDPADILKKIEKTNSQYEELKKKADDEFADKVREFINENDLKGVFIRPTSKRTYPKGTLASQVIGFTNDLGGAMGLEAAYNDELTGENGMVVTARDRDGRSVLYQYDQYFDAENGCDLHTTLDTTIQYYLEKGVQELEARFGTGKGAEGIVMDVNTGAVLAMASLPTYDLNSPGTVYNDFLTSGMTEEQVLENMRDLLNKQWRSKAINDTYEPGSTFKTLTLAMALEENVVDLNTGFYCSGSVKIEGETINCSKRAPGHGQQNLTQAFANSCNPAFINIGLRIGNDKFYQYMLDFGLTEKTVVVIPTASIPQGVSAMMAVDPDMSDADAIAKAMTDAAQCVSTAQITYAARNSDFDGFDIHEGDYLALLDGKLLGTDRDVSALLDGLSDEAASREAEFITVFYGEDVNEEDAHKACDAFTRKCPDAEVNLICGGQPVYYYIISIE